MPLRKPLAVCQLVSDSFNRRRTYPKSPLKVPHVLRRESPPTPAWSTTKDLAQKPFALDSLAQAIYDTRL